MGKYVMFCGFCPKSLSFVSHSLKILIINAFSKRFFRNRKTWYRFKLKFMIFFTDQTDLCPISSTSVSDTLPPPSPAQQLYVSIGQRSSNRRSQMCPVCDKTFTTNWHLRRHSVIHTGERPHICENCGKSFQQKPQLVNHKVLCMSGIL